MFRTSDVQKCGPSFVKSKLRLQRGMIRMQGSVLTREQIQDLRDFGFCVSEEDERGRIAVSGEIIPDLVSLEMLLLTLTFWEEIHYWDADTYSPTDPGGYVTALRWDADSVAYMEGNHGWSSRWKIVSIEEMAKHIQKNWDKDCDRGAYLNRIQISHNKYISRERIRSRLREK